MFGGGSDGGKREQGSKRVVVVGAGLIGVCTGYFLAKEGYDVTIVDENERVAQGTSYSNAGRFCPTKISTYPLANAHVLKQVLTYPATVVSRLMWRQEENQEKNLLEATGDIPSSVTLSSVFIRWGLWYARGCTPARYEFNNKLFRRITLVSNEATRDLMEGLPRGLDSIDFRPDNLWLYGTKESLGLSIKATQGASQSGFANWEVLDCEECSKRYPYLKHYLARIAQTENMHPSCVLAHDDYTVDAYKFAKEVAKCALTYKNPVKFRFKTLVEGFVLDENKKATGIIVAGQEEPIDADHIVLCCGPQAQPFVLKHFGIDLYIQGLRGCAIDLYGVKNGPTVSISDMVCGALNYQTTPYADNRVRLIGFADFVPIPENQDGSGPLDKVSGNPDYEKILLERTKLVFPDMTWTGMRAPWCGIRPVTPDSLPILGLVPPTQNVWLNVGHGSLGWTFAAGTALLLTREILTADNKLVHNSYVDNLTSRYGLESCSPFSVKRFFAKSFFTRAWFER